MTYKQQLRMGRNVEREHLAFYHKIKSKRNCPSDKRFAEGIAKAHIKEDKNYYTKLKRLKL